MTERRPRIEHSQIMAPEDLERIGRLGGNSNESTQILCLHSHIASSYPERSAYTRVSEARTRFESRTSDEYWQSTYTEQVTCGTPNLDW